MNIRLLIHLQPRDWHLPKVTLSLPLLQHTKTQTHTSTHRSNHVKTWILTQRHLQMLDSNIYTFILAHTYTCSLLLPSLPATPLSSPLCRQRKRMSIGSWLRCADHRTCIDPSTPHPPTYSLSTHKHTARA